jgi:hypothetical protein
MSVQIAGQRVQKCDRKPAKIVEFRRKKWLVALDDFRNWVGLGLEAREKK